MTPEPEFEAVMERLKAAIGEKTDAGAAAALSISATAYSERKKRGSIPYEEIARLAASRPLDLQFILTGQARPPAANSVAQTQPYYTVRLNPELLANVLVALDAELESRGLRLTARKRADLVALLYDHFVNRGHVDDESFSRFMNVVLER